MLFVLSGTRIAFCLIKIYHIHKAPCIRVHISVYPSRTETGRQFNGTTGLLLSLFLIFLDLLSTLHDET